MEGKLDGLYEYVNCMHVQIIKGDENDYVLLFCHTHNNGQMYTYTQVFLYMYTVYYTIRIVVKCNTEGIKKGEK